MTITRELEYMAPTTLSEVLEALRPGARVLAGGTDLVAWLRDGAIDVDVIVDIKKVAELREISHDDSAMRIGALSTFSDLLAAPEVERHFPLISEMAGMVASVGIRNRATLVGNLCSAVPSCDAGPVLLVLDAQLQILGPSGTRVVPITEWFTGPRRTALEAGEVVTAVLLPIDDVVSGAAFARLTRYRGEDLAQASVAVVAGDGFRVAFGAVAPTPIRAFDLERELERTQDPEALRASVRAAIAPISDVRASAEYRAAMTEVMFERALQVAVARRSGSGPPYGTHLI